MAFLILPFIAESTEFLGLPCCDTLKTLLHWKKGLSNAKLCYLRVKHYAVLFEGGSQQCSYYCHLFDGEDGDSLALGLPPLVESLGAGRKITQWRYNFFYCFLHAWEGKVIRDGLF